ncbi:MAG UNVERIFIED_CONTAM: hypothetical protein LVR18_50755 [Planctomycetaceae bacterium]
MPLVDAAGGPPDESPPELPQLTAQEEVIADYFICWLVAATASGEFSQETAG